MKTKIFLSIEGILYVTFICLDCIFPEMGRLSTDIKYVGILLCFFYVLCMLPKECDRNDAMVIRTALFFTLLADTFLLFIGDYELGIACFIMVQVCYFYRLHPKNIGSIVINILLFIGVYFIEDRILEELDVSVILAGFYGVSLIRNVWDSFFFSKNSLFQLGLVLFLLCDISVVLFNLPHILAVPNWYMSMLYPLVAVLIWIFYLPSQVAFVLSVRKL